MRLNRGERNDMRMNESRRGGEQRVAMSMLDSITKDGEAVKKADDTSVQSGPGPPISISQ